MLPIKIDLPKGFLEEEVRCGYTISAEMKKLWAVELDLLAEFDRVCRKNNLTYYAFGGTLLGAVRHRGFIPWDDDIDVVMFREDFEKLSEIADKEFQHPYFFQTPFSDPGLVMGGCRLRNSDTTVSNDVEFKRPYKNKGIFIDLFVIDGIPDKESRLRKLKSRLKLYWRLLRYAAYYDCYFEKGKKYPVKRLLAGKLSLGLKYIFGIERLSRGYGRLCSKYSGRNTKQIAPLEFSRGKDIYQREWYGGTVYVPFEHMRVPVPEGFDQLLSATYGDYMVMKRVPPVHRPFTFDTEIPFSVYYAKRPEFEEKSL